MTNRIIAISNMKSASGRSTIALHISVALARLGRNVLLVDLAGGFTLQPVLLPPGNPSPAVQYYAGLPVHAARIPLLAVCDARVKTVPLALDMDRPGETPNPLRDQLIGLRECLPIEFIILDTPEANGNHVTEQALLASDQVIIPSRTMDLLCAPGVTAMIQRLDFLRVERAWKGDLLGVLPNFYNASNGQSAWGYNTLREFHEPLLLDPIRSSTEYDEARQRGKTAYDLDRPTMAVEDFDRLAARVVESESMTLPPILTAQDKTVSAETA